MKIKLSELRKIIKEERFKLSESPSFKPRIQAGLIELVGEYEEELKNAHNENEFEDVMSLILHVASDAYDMAAQWEAANDYFMWDLGGGDFEEYGEYNLLDALADAAAEAQ